MNAERVSRKHYSDRITYFSLLEDTLQKGAISLSGDLLLEVIHLPGGPGMNRWVDIAEAPLLGKNLTIEMYIPFTCHLIQLIRVKLRIHIAERDGKDIACIEMEPGRIAALAALRRRGWQVGSP